MYLIQPQDISHTIIPLNCVEQVHITGGATCNCFNSGEYGEVMVGPIYTVVTKQECYVTCCVHTSKFRWWAWTAVQMQERVQHECSGGYPV